MKRALGVAAIALIAAACGKPASSPPTTITVTVTATPTTTAAPTTVAASPLFTLVNKPRANMESWAYAAGASLDHVVPNGIYVEVAAELKNISARPQEFVMHDQRLVDAQQREFSPDMRVTGTPDVREVNPGNTTNIDPINFDVPKGTQLSDYRLVLRDSAGVFAIVQLGG